MTTAQRRRPTIGFGLAGIASLAWNALGVADYVLTNGRDAEYLARVSPQAVQAMDAFPLWVTAVWGLGIAAALCGSLLLLRRSAWAVPAFAASLAGLAGGTGYRLAMDVPDPGAGMTVLLWVAALAQLGWVWRCLRRRELGPIRAGRRPSGG